MNPATIRQEIADRLKTIDGLAAFGYAQTGVSPPFAWLLPEQVTYHETYAGGGAAGGWTMTGDLIVAAGKPDDRSTEARLDVYVATTGDASILAVLESGTYTAFDEITVTQAKWEVGQFAEAIFRFARFPVEIIGRE